MGVDGIRAAQPGHGSGFGTASLSFQASRYRQLSALPGFVIAGEERPSRRRLGGRECRDD
jgi:hypothetical protein